MRMTSVTDSTERAAPVDRAGEVWTTRALFARHKLLGIGAVALLVLLLAIIAGGILSSSTAVVNDASTCATWAAANQTQQQRYAQRYVREHGPLPGGATAAASVVTAISNGCNDAFSNDVEDSVTVLQAIKEG
jgi:hypothetical protein